MLSNGPSWPIERTDKRQLYCSISVPSHLEKLAEVCVLHFRERVSGTETPSIASATFNFLRSPLFSQTAPEFKSRARCLPLNSKCGSLLTLFVANHQALSMRNWRRKSTTMPSSAGS